MRLAYAPYRLRFRNPAGTSRGVLTEKLTCFLKFYDENDPSRFGLGEAAIFEGLSPEAGGGYEIKLLELVANVALGRPTDLSCHSSIQFGFEQAILDYSNGCEGVYFPSSFTEGKSEIEINGLVWMGSLDEMLSRLRSKVEEGFSCIKIKIGAIDWNKELELLNAVRNEFGSHDLMLRVDANGGFDASNVMSRLEALALLDVHSIEQPVRAGQLELMAEICRNSPVPVALDEELIGIYDAAGKEDLLDIVGPAYVILKPALCGGFQGASEWIAMATKRNIGWWVTSALESNVGLDAIAQWTASIGAEGPQGLGTGMLFTNNFSSPVSLSGDRLSYDPSVRIDRTVFDSLDWRG
ncbi:MAG: o-succinylbenzoate synthase [Bacteroidales bacterium]|nr:o-succinylbenzoate synthase [Bacteroidales bacterium]